MTEYEYPEAERDFYRAVERCRLALEDLQHTTVPGTRRAVLDTYGASAVGRKLCDIEEQLSHFLDRRDRRRPHAGERP